MENPGVVEIKTCNSFVKGSENIMLLELQQQTRLSPARVRRVAGQRLQLEMDDEWVWGVLALAYPYTPALDDRVLAIGQDGDWFVIGVLQGTGKTTLTVPGDLCLRAPSGAIELDAGREVKIKGPTVQINAAKLEMRARTVFERFTNVTRWVKETFQIRAGRLRARVEGTYDLKADRIIERADGDVKIDGREIKLG
jgi:hypothetical protein